jgi:hypothetical protein
MKYKTLNSKIQTVKEGDPQWILKDGIVTAPRAGFEISQRCPDNYKSLILECIEHGWLKPVAYVYGKTLTMDALR